MSGLAKAFEQREKAREENEEKANEWRKWRKRRKEGRGQLMLLMESRVMAGRLGDGKIKLATLERTLLLPSSAVPSKICKSVFL